MLGELIDVLFRDKISDVSVVEYFLMKNQSENNIFCPRSWERRISQWNPL